MTLSQFEKRLTVFVLYSPDGEICRYIEYLIKSLLDISFRVIIVVNGKISEKATTVLYSYTTDVFKRDNIGFDGGGYKDVFLSYINPDELLEYDEILLVNDTFYGPFFSWKDLFDRMKTQDTDFWGLTAQGNYLDPDGTFITPHIQGYFILCKKRLFASDTFRLFWEQLQYPKTYHEAVHNFEIRFTSFFQEKGFLWKVYTDVTGFTQPERREENVYLKHPYELIIYGGVPILKRRSTVLDRYEDIRKILHYLGKNSDYPTSLIFDGIRYHERYSAYGKQIFSYMELDDFCNKHKHIYIFGNGKYGKIIADYLTDHNQRFEKYIVSTINKKSDNVIILNDYHPAEGDGLIVALGKQASKEVFSVLINMMPRENMLFSRAMKELEMVNV